MATKITESITQEIADERAITNVVNLYARGVDRLDWEVVRSCFHSDARIRFGQETDLDTFIENASRGLAEGYSATTHHVSNVLVQVNGDAAVAESYVLCGYRAPGTEHEADIQFTWAGRHLDEFAFRDGAWRITRRTAVHEWTTLAPVMGTWHPADAFVQGKRSREDIVYRHWA